MRHILLAIDKSVLLIPIAMETGTFIRHSCGVFGDIPRDLSVTFTWIDDLFDCINMGTAFHVYSGKVTYTSRYYVCLSLKNNEKSTLNIIGKTVMVGVEITPHSIHDW